MLEKFDRIIKARNERINSFGAVNVSHSSSRLAYNLTKAHDLMLKGGSPYTDFKTILPKLNIQPTPTNCFFEFADMICYAHQRAYHDWLCEKLGKKIKDTEDYLPIIQNLSEHITIGSHQIHLGSGKKIKIKILPYPRKF